MEPEGSSPHSQAPATCPYPEPAQYSPHLLKVHPNIILPSTPGSPQRSLPLGFRHQHPVHSSPFPHTGHMLRRQMVPHNKHMMHLDFVTCCLNLVSCTVSFVTFNLYESYNPPCRDLFPPACKLLSMLRIVPSML